MHKVAVVVSGGGSHGSFAVGALKHLIKTLKVKPDIYCGVSIGAVIASHMAMYPYGQEEAAWAHLEELFMGLHTEDVRKSWFPFGVLMAPWRPSIYNNGPSEAMIRKRLDVTKLRTSGKDLIVGATNLNSGHYCQFTQHHHDIVSCVMASAAFPGFFKPVQILGDWYTDGGVREVSPLKAAIDAGADEIFCVTLSPEDSSLNHDKDFHAHEVALRALSLALDQIVADDIRVAELYNRLIAAGAEGDKRLIEIHHIRPEKSIEGDSLAFDPEVTARNIDRGVKAAKKAVPHG